MNLKIRMIYIRIYVYDILRYISHTYLHVVYLYVCMYVYMSTSDGSPSWKFPTSSRSSYQQHNTSDLTGCLFVCMQYHIVDITIEFQVHRYIIYVKTFVLRNRFVGIRNRTMTGTKWKFHFIITISGSFDMCRARATSFDLT